MHHIKISILLLAGAFTTASWVQAQRIIGYYPSWGIYARNYHVPDIPAEKITHINYAFAKISGGKIALGDHYADVDKFYPGDSWNAGALRGSFNRLLVLKKKHPHVKTLISIGGWTWSSPFSDAVLTSASRNTFASSCVNFIVKYGFDGVDLDWEYPVAGGLASNKTRPEDKQNYTLFLQELRRQLDAKTKTTNKSYLLTIAYSASPTCIANIEIAKVHPILDWINIMAYDLHGPWKGAGDPVTNFNAPLYPVASDPTPEPYKSTFNAWAATELYLKLGVPPEKLNMGLAFYGRGYGGVQGNATGLYASYTGPAPVGTWERGVFDYDDLAKNYVGKNGFTSYRHPQARVPWVHHSTRKIMIGYDDPRSIREKTWFIKSTGIGGAMFWEFSGDRQAVLLDEIKRELHEAPALVATTRRISTSKPARIDLGLVAGKTRAKRQYVVAGSFAGNHPGIALPGGTLPLNPDPFLTVSLTLANTPIFANTFASLDASGQASCALDFSSLKTLPPSLAGHRLSLAAWILKGVGAAGETTNTVDLLFVK